MVATRPLFERWHVANLMLRFGRVGVNAGKNRCGAYASRPSIPAVGPVTTSPADAARYGGLEAPTGIDEG